MIRSKEWYEHAVRTIKSLKEFRQQSPLGNYNSPAEYMDTLEDFGKLFYDLNGIPDDVLVEFRSTSNAFLIFKNKVENLCEILLKRVESENH